MRWCYVLVLVLGLVGCWCKNVKKSKRDKLIDYYVSMILRETKAAMHYNLPTSSQDYKPKTNTVRSFGSYDFIVIGAGSAGSAIAGRLSEIRQWKVLLLEAGGPETDFSQITGVYDLLQGSRFNWNFNTTRQTDACLGMIDFKCPMPRGKALGGSSAINGMVYYRLNRYDFDRWADQGNPGWSYRDVLPYFIKSENAQLEGAGDEGYYGIGGPLNVTFKYPFGRQMKSIIEAHQEIYIGDTNRDYNGRSQVGMFRTQHVSDRQFRLSSYKAFVKPYLNRKNLKVSQNSYVTKIMIDKTSLTANGIEFVKGGKIYRAYAKREVVLSGGAINSPQILMLSGIGPESHLTSLGIPVVRDLPVGQHFTDHTIFHGMYISTNITEPTLTLRQHVQDFFNNTGMLTIASNIQGVGFYRTPRSSSNHDDYPDLELLISTATGADAPDEYIKRNIKVRDEIYDALFAKVDYKKSFSAYIYLLNQTSYGRILLTSKDPFEYPLIDLKYLSNPEELDVMYEGVRKVQELLDTHTMRSIDAKIFLADYPQCRSHEPGSEDYWRCALRLLSASGYHQMGSCRMGPDSSDSVVDYRGKVHGIKGLRVADASVIPVMHSGHTNAPAMMIGEKISDQIKLDHGRNIQHQLPISVLSI